MAQSGGRPGRARSASRRAVVGGDDATRPTRPTRPPGAPSRPIAATPPERLTLLRRQARQAGLAINSRSDPRAAGARRYTLVDGATKAVVAGGIRDLDTLATELWWRIRERADHRQDLAQEDRSVESCAGCGTPRVGAFRYCRSCGRDFEEDAARPDVQAVPDVSDARVGKGLLSLPLVASIAASDGRQASVEPVQAEVPPQARDTRADDPRPAVAPTPVRPGELPSQAPMRQTWILVAIGLAIGVGCGVLVSLVAATILR